MSKPIQHPIRDHQINVWAPMSEGLPFIAFIGTGSKFPIKFTGETAFQAKRKADKFKSETIDKYETAYIARREAAANRKSEPV